MGHPSVAFSDPQLYHLLRLLAEESAQVSFDVMKANLLEVAEVLLDALEYNGTFT